MDVNNEGFFEPVEQEPVAWRFQSAVGGWAYGKEPPIGSKYAVEPLYTTPPQRTWVDLSRNEILEIINAFYKNNASEREVKFARLIQEAAKEKNT